MYAGFVLVCMMEMAKSRVMYNKDGGIRQGDIGVVCVGLENGSVGEVHIGVM